MTTIAQIILAIALVLSIILPFGYYLIGEKNRGRYKTALGVNAFFFFGTMLIAIAVMFTGASSVQAATGSEAGLATGMDTDAMVKSMLTADQEKIDKAQQKEQTVKWQQEIYREVMSDIIDFNDKYFSLTSKDSILSNSAWNTLSITSSNSSVISATGNAGATNVDYKFNVKKKSMQASGL